MIKKAILIITFLFIFIAGSLALEDVYYYINKGDDYFYKYDYDTAIVYYEKALELDPENILALFQIGESYLGKKLYENAVNIYLKVINIPEGNAYISQINSRAINIAD